MKAITKKKLKCDTPPKFLIAAPEKILPTPMRRGGGKRPLFPVGYYNGLFPSLRVTIYSNTMWCVSQSS